HATHYFPAYDPMAPDVSVPLPSTVLFPRDRSIAMERLFKRPVLLSVTVELETLTVATPVDVLCASMPTILFEATQLSIFSSAGALVIDKASKPLLLADAMLLRTVTLDP